MSNCSIFLQDIQSLRDYKPLLTTQPIATNIEVPFRTQKLAMLQVLLATVFQILTWRQRISDRAANHDASCKAKPQDLIDNGETTTRSQQKSVQTQIILMLDGQKNGTKGPTTLVMTYQCPAIQFWAFSGFRTFSGDSTPSLILRFNPCFMGLMVFFPPHVWWLPRPNCWWLLSPGLTTISGRLNHHSGKPSRNCSPNCMLHLLSHGRSFNRRAWSWSTLGST